MAIKESLKQFFIKLGENNKPTYAVMAIATVKGIARPAFTMSDKNADPTTKKYTAIREALTEAVAIPTYFICGEMAAKISSMLSLPKEKQNLAKRNFMFLGVCTAALVVIPALASIVIKPFMNKIQEKPKDAKIELNMDSNIKRVGQAQSFKGRGYQRVFYPISYGNYGMKAGGL